MEVNKIYNMDCMEGMKLLDDNSIDSIVTDPPYGLVSIQKRFGKANSAPAQYGKDGAFARLSKGFMGKEWDGTGIQYNVELWKEALRVLKPGGHLLAFGGTRTYHRMACAIEDAGFEIRDSIQNFFATNNIAQEFLKSLTQEQTELFWRLLDAYGLAGQMAWIYGSGFPKSMDISKAIDKHFGAEREVIGHKIDISTGKPMSPKQARAGSGMNINDGWDRPWRQDEEHCKDMTLLTAPTTPEAKQWDGWGTALKPANEPICVARKPLSEGTVAENVLKWGTGGINIDGCRIGTEGGGTRCNKRDGLGNCLGHPDRKGTAYGVTYHAKESEGVEGRFPANVIFDEEAGRLLDEQSGISKSKKSMRGVGYTDSNIYGVGNKEFDTERGFNDSGGASRFFYCAKASKKERGEGNKHPTVKPVDLMEYLIKLVTPAGGVVLDPFIGSGTTAIAAINLGLHYIGFELEKENYDIANQRIERRKRQGLQVSLL